MAKYCKKPVEIDAWQFYEDGLRNAPQWLLEKLNSSDVSVETSRTQYADRRMGIKKRTTLSITTLEGTMVAQEGDYIIRGVQGEIYPCKPDIFDKTYEKIK